MMEPTQQLELSTSGELVDFAAARAVRAERDRTALDEYDVAAQIARGGMGGVYLATDRTKGEMVAIKLLAPRFAEQADIVARLFAERAVSERVKHENLVDVRVARYSNDGVPFLVIEYLDGENLGDLAERGRMELIAVVGIATQIAAGGAALHAAGIAHCDLKQDNIVVLYEPEGIGYPYIKIVDYGVAHIPGLSPMDESTIAGTPACMAPEQWRGAPTSASDVYALGCMLFELLTGDALFGGTLPELAIAHAHQVPRRASAMRDDVPPALDALIAAMLDKNPERRPAMFEIAEALNSMLPALPLVAVGY